MLSSLPLLLTLVLAGPAPAEECRNPPPRGSDAYWVFIDSCGCDALETPARASDDYERFLNACSQWRQRNPQGNVAGSGTTSSPAECRNPPSRASDSFWSYLEACGCAGVDTPARASSNYERFLKACGQWRERNPRVEVAAPSPAPTPRPTATPTPRPSPTATPKPPGGC